MRTLLFASLFAAGCLSDPTGRDQAWPPPGLSVAAVAAGDLDGDDLDDLVVLDGNGIGALYLLRGADDFQPSPDAATRYATRGAAEFAMAPRLVVSDGHVLLFDGALGGARLQVFDQALTLQWVAQVTDSAADNRVLSAHPSTFGQNGSVLFTTAHLVRFIEHEMIASPTLPLEVFREVMPPAGDFNMPLAADVVITGPGPAAVGLASEPTQTLRGTSTAMPPVYDWMPVNRTGTWPLQIVGDVNGGPVTDILAVRDDGSICVVDGALEPSAPQPTCLIPIPPGTMPTALAYADLGGPPGGAVMLRGAGMLIAPGIRIENDPPMTTAGGAPITLTSTVGPPFAILTVSTGTARALLAIAPGGAIGCYRFDQGSVAECAR